MSVIMRNICGGGSGSSSSKGFPPGDISNISIRSGYKCVKIKWADPGTSVYNGTTLSTWSSTIIVRKEGSAPTSIKDGTVVLTNTTKNKYKDTEFTDNNVVVGKTYYYRFYTMSTNKVYNDSTSMIGSVKVFAADSILKNNTWEQINAVSEAGIASSLWKIGDEIDLILKHKETATIYDQTVTLQIWDFNHFDKSDGSGKAGICFGMKNLMKDTFDFAGAYADWEVNSSIHPFMNRLFDDYIPSDLQSYIKQVNLYTYCGSGSPATGTLTKDKIFLPGAAEVDKTGPGEYTGDKQQELNQKQFPIFTDNNSRIKKLSNGSGSDYGWWTRSTVYGDYGHIYCIGGGGGVYSSYSYDTENGLCFCFNV